MMCFRMAMEKLDTDLNALVEGDGVIAGEVLDVVALDHLQKNG